MGTQATASGHMKRPAVEPDAAIRIDAEFAALIPARGKRELAKFERQILAEGCQDALIVWSGYNILLDGHDEFRSAAGTTCPSRFGT